MSFLHPALLAMAALAAVPVILHLIMRPKPKRLMFPALRLIESRRKSNVRRLRLRHIWLLLLRVAIILLLVLALARPLVPAANYGLTGGEMFIFAGIALVCLVGYFAALRFWARPAPRGDFLYRRSLLRGGSGLLAALLVLLLVAWPYARRITAEVTNPDPAQPSEDRPVAAVFLFDTSASMAYQFKGQSRLEQARTIALAQLSKLPAGSRVAVATSAGTEPVVFQADLAGAQARIEALDTQALSQPLEQRVRSAFTVQENDRQRGIGAQVALPEAQRRDHFARAVYLFTDLAASAWNGAKTTTLQQKLESNPWLQMFVVDVGVKEPVNVGIVGAEPSVDVATAEQAISLQVRLTASGSDSSDATVQLYVQQSGEAIKQGQTTVRVTPGQANPIKFPLVPLAEHIIQGELRLLQGDPFTPDAVRHFTVTIEPRPQILVVADEPLDAMLWSEALRARGYDVTDVKTEQLGTQRLETFAAIYLINVKAPKTRTWERLAEHVRRGNGLGIILGTRVDPLAYNAEAAKALLPANVLAQVSFEPPEFFRPLDDNHPVFAPFAELGGYGWLTRRDVRRHYVVEPDEGAAVIAAYTYDEEQRPALVLDAVGAGRVALLTTGVDSTNSWSDLPKAVWPFLALADHLTQYIAGRSGGKRNFVIGETATIRLPGVKLPKKVLLRTPTLDQRPISVQQNGLIVLDELHQIGSYTLTSPPDTPKIHGGLSVNLPPSESDFTRLGKSDLDSLFGADRYQIATDADSLEVVVRDATLGAEFMPYLAIALILIFCGEQWVSNRFYDEEQKV